MNRCAQNLIRLMLLTFLTWPAAAADASSSARDAYVQRADAALDAGPYSVMNKTAVAPSGDKHDYYSLSPFHWPNPRRDDGLPYIFRDGEKNPEVDSDKYDRVPYFQLTDAVEDLGRGYRLTGEEKYAEKAASLLHTWFLDPETRMNPNLEYAEWVKGARKQKPWGIIRGRRIVDMDEVTQWIGDSDAWTEADEAAWKNWLSEYVDWLLTSEKGKEEADAWNNHGTWYDVQVVHIALRTGRDDLTRDVLQDAKKKRIASHIDPDGSQPKELIRTKAWSYSVMNLEGLFELARMGEAVDVDLWNYEPEDGGSLKDALDYLVQYLPEDKEWPHGQLGGVERNILYPLLREAERVYGAPYGEIAGRLPNTASQAIRYSIRHGATP